MIYCSSVLGGIWLPSQSPAVVAGREEGARHRRPHPLLGQGAGAGGRAGSPHGDGAMGQGRPGGAVFPQALPATGTAF